MSDDEEEGTKRIKGVPKFVDNLRLDRRSFHVG